MFYLSIGVYSIPPFQKIVNNKFWMKYIGQSEESSFFKEKLRRNLYVTKLHQVRMMMFLLHVHLQKNINDESLFRKWISYQKFNMSINLHDLSVKIERWKNSEKPTTNQKRTRLQDSKERSRKKNSRIMICYRENGKFYSTWVDWCCTYSNSPSKTRDWKMLFSSSELIFRLRLVKWSNHCSNDDIVQAHLFITCANIHKYTIIIQVASSYIQLLRTIMMKVVDGNQKNNKKHSWCRYNVASDFGAFRKKPV